MCTPVLVTSNVSFTSTYRARARPRPRSCGGWILKSYEKEKKPKKVFIKSEHKEEEADEDVYKQVEAARRVCRFRFEDKTLCLWSLCRAHSQLWVGVHEVVRLVGGSRFDTRGTGAILRCGVRRSHLRRLRVKDDRGGGSSRTQLSVPVSQLPRLLAYYRASPQMAHALFASIAPWIVAHATLSPFYCTPTRSMIDSLSPFLSSSSPVFSSSSPYHSHTLPPPPPPSPTCASLAMQSILRDQRHTLSSAESRSDFPFL